MSSIRRLYVYLINAIRTWKGNLLNTVHAYQWPSDFMRYMMMWIDFRNPLVSRVNEDLSKHFSYLLEQIIFFFFSVRCINYNT